MTINNLGELPSVVHSELGKPLILPVFNVVLFLLSPLKHILSLGFVNSICEIFNRLTCILRHHMVFVEVIVSVSFTTLAVLIDVRSE
jgi:hypothetical protein